jgi:uncharacterized repeat protein (TIGR03803 family)
MDFWMIAAVAAIAALLMVAASQAQAQTFTALHNFTGGADGAAPTAGLTMDAAGNLYGTASGGGYQGSYCSGTYGCGTVFRLKHEASGWILTPLYTFTGPDGASPQARVIIGPDGNLYGTTSYGGAAGKGAVFKLSPPPSACKSALCPWTETVLYSFQGSSDGEFPQYGDVVFDQQGNIYGTTPYGGGVGSGCYQGCGVVYKLTPSNGGWTESILYRFQDGNDGAYPYAGLTFDTAGDLYGTTENGLGFGTVYKLTPSGNGWSESVIYAFGGISGEPYGGLIFDQAGNLYGAASGENSSVPVVYELTPADGAWTFNQLYAFYGAYVGSLAKLAMDPAGRLYGTIFLGSPEVFQLTPSDGQWTLTGFSGDAGDYPYGNVIFDASGNVYSTASNGGPHNYGVVFEIAP